MKTPIPQLRNQLCLLSVTSFFKPFNLSNLFVQSYTLCYCAAAFKLEFLLSKSFNFVHHLIPSLLSKVLYYCYIALKFPKAMFFNLVIFVTYFSCNIKALVNLDLHYLSFKYSSLSPCILT